MNEKAKQIIASAIPIARLRDLRGDSDDEQAWLILKELEKAGQICIDKDMLIQISDYLQELIGEWHWRKSEPRGGLGKEFAELEKTAEKVIKLIKEVENGGN